MDKYYVSGCIEIEGDCSRVEDDKADFFTLYERDAEGLSHAIVDLGTRKDAEVVMAVYMERDRLQEQVKVLAVECNQAKSVISECRQYFIAGIRNTIRPTNEGYLHMICDTFGDESTARAALKEFKHQSNTLSYRQILDKHAKRI